MEELVIGVNAKVCKDCNTLKSVSEFQYAKGCKLSCRGNCKECIRIYKQSRRERDRELTNASRARNRARVNATHRAWYTNNREMYMCKQAKSRAKLKDIEFDIEPSDIIIPDYCPILGVKLTLGTKDNYQCSPSLDRVDTTKGYVKGNVQVISSLANTMKNCATREQLLLFCKNIPDYINEDIVQTV